MKYKLFRAGKSIDENIRSHELVAVEFGRSIMEAEEGLVQAVKDDLIGSPDYEKCDASVFPPEPVESFRRTRRYQYEIRGILAPHAQKHIMVEYGIMEERE